MSAFIFASIAFEFMFRANLYCDRPFNIPFLFDKVMVALHVTSP
jgi:hypothetical protein